MAVYFHNKHDCSLHLKSRIVRKISNHHLSWVQFQIAFKLISVAMKKELAWSPNEWIYEKIFQLKVIVVKTWFFCISNCYVVLLICSFAQLDWIHHENFIRQLLSFSRGIWNVSIIRHEIKLINSHFSINFHIILLCYCMFTVEFT